MTGRAENERSRSETGAAGCFFGTVAGKTVCKGDLGPRWETDPGQFTKAARGAAHKWDRWDTSFLFPGRADAKQVGKLALRKGKTKDSFD